MIRSFAVILFGALITLHTPSGREVFVNADEIMVIRNSEPLWCAGPAAVTVHDHEICVRETPAHVKQLVEEAKQ